MSSNVASNQHDSNDMKELAIKLLEKCIIGKTAKDCVDEKEEFLIGSRAKLSETKKALEVAKKDFSSTSKELKTLLSTLTVKNSHDFMLREAEIRATQHDIAILEKIARKVKGGIANEVRAIIRAKEEYNTAKEEAGEIWEEFDKKFQADPQPDTELVKKICEAVEKVFII